MNFFLRASYAWYRPRVYQYMSTMHSDERPTVVDELRHLPAAEMMRVTRARRDQNEAQRLAALFQDYSTTTPVEVPCPE